MGRVFERLAARKRGTGLKKQSQLGRRRTSAPGHENGDTADVPVFDLPPMGAMIAAAVGSPFAYSKSEY